jgi:hypothetical protein
MKSFLSNSTQFAGAELQKNVKRSTAAKKPKKSSTVKKAGGSELTKTVK